MRPLVSIQVFGDLQIASWRAKGFAEFGNRQHVRSLIALVAGSQRPLDRDLVLDSLWPSGGERAGSNRLHHTLHLARRAISSLAWNDEWIVMRDEKIHLHPLVVSDARYLASLCLDLEGASDASLLQALAICRQPWMPDLDAGLLGERIRNDLIANRQAVLQKACERTSFYGDASVRRRLLAALIQVEPTNEWAWRETMQLDLLAGRPSRVVKSWQQVSRVLGEGLGLKPSSKVRDLLERAQKMLIAHQSQSRPTSISSTVRPLGVEAQLRTIIAEGQSPQVEGGHSVINLYGFCGSGKTQLAIAILEHIRIQLQSPATYLSASDLLLPGSRDSFVQTIADQSDPNGWLVVDDVNTNALATCLRMELEKQSVRIGCLVLVSRTPLDWPRSFAARVAAPGATEHGLAKDSSRAELCGFEIFDANCPVSSEHGPPPEWRHDIAVLLKRYGASPLAICLMARRANFIAPGDYLVQSDRLFRKDLPRLPDLPERHQSLAAAMKETLASVSATGALLSGVFAVFPAGGSRDDIAAIANACGLLKPSADINACIEELSNVGLIDVNPNDGSARPDALLADYARIVVTESGLWSVMLAHRFSRASQQIEALDLNTDSPSYLFSLGVLGELTSPLEPLLDELLSIHPEAFVRIGAHFLHVWSQHGFYDRALVLGRRLLEHLPASQIKPDGAAAIARWAANAFRSSSCQPARWVTDLQNCTSNVRDTDSALDPRSFDSWRLAGQEQQHSGSLRWLEELQGAVARSLALRQDRISLAQNLYELSEANGLVRFKLNAQLLIAMAQFEANCSAPELRQLVASAIKMAVESVSNQSAAWVCVAAAFGSWHNDELGDPNQWLRNAEEFSDDASADSLMLSLALAEIIVMILDSKAEDAFDLFASLDEKHLESVDEITLFLWLEASGLLVAQMRDQALAKELRMALHSLQPVVTEIASVANFLDQKIAVEPQSNAESGLRITQHQAIKLAHRAWHTIACRTSVS